jgi:hypothetical protein
MKPGKREDGSSAETEKKRTRTSKMELQALVEPVDATVCGVGA